MDPDFQKQVAEAAREAGHSQNAFIVAAMEGIMEMIDTPEGKPVMEPRLVAIARFLKRHKPDAVKPRD